MTLTGMFLIGYVVGSGFACAFYEWVIWLQGWGHRNRAASRREGGKS